MRLIVNGAAVADAKSRSVAELLAELGYAPSLGETPLHLAVALNLELVRRADYARTRLQDGDEVEVLAPMAGG